MNIKNPLTIEQAARDIQEEVNKMEQKRYLTVDETAEYLSMSAKSLRNAIAPKSKTQFKINGKIFKPTRINRQIRFDRQKLDEAMSQN